MMGTIEIDYNQYPFVCLHKDDTLSHCIKYAS